MTKCPNCKMAQDLMRSKEISREAYFCGSDEAGRISVACSTIRDLKDTITLLRQDNKRLKTEIENGKDTEENHDGN